MSCSPEPATGMQAWLSACYDTTMWTHHPCNAMYCWCICAVMQWQHDGLEAFCLWVRSPP